MNKIIFQIGILAFCVAAVAYASLGYDAVDIVARSFIVFIAAIVVVVAVIVGTSLLTTKQKHGTEGSGETA
ncbi:MAG: hypothetical protein F9K22_01340 [Bacteroidetes bacterium]|nr:MAG: hypothetical protein F9K22_01340 [Bacteroidota bacterium]